MSTLRLFRSAVAEMFREGPRLFADWLDRLAREINGPKDDEQ